MGGYRGITSSHGATETAEILQRERKNAQSQTLLTFLQHSGHEQIAALCCLRRRMYTVCMFSNSKVDYIAKLWDSFTALKHYQTSASVIDGNVWGAKKGYV